MKFKDRFANFVDDVKAGDKRALIIVAAVVVVLLIAVLA